MTAADRRPEGWRSHGDPLSAELVSFPEAVGDAAAKDKSERKAIAKAATALARLATEQHTALTYTNLAALGFPHNVLRLEPVIFIPPDGVEAAAEVFALKYADLIDRIAEAIVDFEGP
jgi:hypothetical protein